MPTVKVKVDFKQPQRRLKIITTGLQNLTEPLNEMGDDLLKFYGEKNFKTQGASLGAPWSPLAASTLLARARGTGHYANPPIATGKVLIWTGAMQKAFKKTVLALRLTIENTIFYFKYNQPKRMMLSINVKVEKIVLKVMEKYINKLISQ